MSKIVSIVLLIVVALSRAETGLVINGLCDGRKIGTFSKFEFNQCYNLQFKILGLKSVKYVNISSTKYYTYGYKEFDCKTELNKLLYRIDGNYVRDKSTYFGDPNYDVYMVTHQSDRTEYYDSDLRYYFTGQCVNYTDQKNYIGYSSFTVVDNKFVRLDYNNSECIDGVIGKTYGTCGEVGSFEGTIGTIICDSKLDSTDPAPLIAKGGNRAVNFFVLIFTLILIIFFLYVKKM